MKLYKSLLTGLFGLVSLASCLSETPFEDRLAKDNQGLMDLNVDIVKPKTRAVTETKDFPVIIYDAEGKEFMSFKKVSEISSPITMSVGTYNVESHTPGEIQKKMYEPYYKGVQEVEILKGITSQVEVLCKMENSIISVVYDDEFRSTFASWEITLDDGSETALSFTSTNAINSVYWYFGEDGAKTLSVNFRGTTKEGSNISAKYELTKDQADESYDDDRENFCGGDALNLKFTATEATDGKLTGVTINADVTFTETNQNITVNVVDVPGQYEDPDEGGSDQPGEGGGEGQDDNAITLTLPAPVSFDAAGAMAADPASGDVKMEAKEGLKSVLVKVVSDSQDLMEQLAEFPETYPGVDLVNGCEVVGNQGLVEFLGSLHKVITVPSQGDKEYTFPVGQFYSFLGILPGHHNFIMTVTDMKGNVKSGTIQITITE